MEVVRDQNPSLKARGWAAAWRSSRGHTRPAPSGNGALAKKSNRTKPIAPAGTGLRAPQKEWVGLGEFGRDEENEKGREKRRKWGGGRR